MLIALSHISVSSVPPAFAIFLQSAKFPCGNWRVPLIRKLHQRWFPKRKYPQSTTQIPNYVLQIIKKKRRPKVPNIHIYQPTTQVPNYIPQIVEQRMKRNQVLVIQSSESSVSKRRKNDFSQSEKAPGAAIQALETQTDSDPIVESDTTENSGDDNGVTWPSDHASAAQESYADEEGGVPISQSTSRKGQYVLPRKVRSAKNAGNGMISPSTHQGNLTNQKYQVPQRKPTPSKRP